MNPLQGFDSPLSLSLSFGYELGLRPYLIERKEKDFLKDILFIKVKSFKRYFTY